MYTNRGDELLGFLEHFQKYDGLPLAHWPHLNFLEVLTREGNLKGLQYRALAQRLDMEASAPEDETEILHGMGLILLHKW